MTPALILQTQHFTLFSDRFFTYVNFFFYISLCKFRIFIVTVIFNFGPSLSLKATSLNDLTCKYLARSLSEITHSQVGSEHFLNDIYTFVSRFLKSVDDCQNSQTFACVPIIAHSMGPL